MDRNHFLKLSLGGMAWLGTMNIRSFASHISDWKETDKMPAIFVGHGAPTYVLTENKFTLAWRKIGESIPRPKAIVCVSAHWLTQGKTLVSGVEKPQTIHDFGGFARELYEMHYPAPGSPELAEDIAKNVHFTDVEIDHKWGLDHGTWCVLYHMFPDADIPVIQLSIDYRKGADYHFNLAKDLYYLRKKGVLVVASGNIVHNLRVLNFRDENSQYDWAIEFDAMSRELMNKGDYKSLIDYEKLGNAARMSIPTPDHYYPLMYTLGMSDEKDEITYPVDGITYGSTSMRSVILS